MQRHPAYQLTRFTVKSLMFGFGDDYYSSPETASVMEDILIEYITNVVRFTNKHSLQPTRIVFSALLPLVHQKRAVSKWKISVESSQDLQTTRNWPEWRSFSSCKKISNGQDRLLRMIVSRIQHDRTTMMILILPRSRPRHLSPWHHFLLSQLVHPCLSPFEYTGRFQ